MGNTTSDESLLLHNDCTRMLRRPSKQLLILDVLTRMNNLDKLSEEISPNKIFTEKNNIKNVSFFEKFLKFICCKID
jgi:hypothetical protein